MRLCRSAFCFFLFTLPFSTVAQESNSAAIRLTPAFVVAGSPEMVRVHAPQATKVDGEWLNRKIEFFRGQAGEWVALAGVDLEAPEGPSVLHIHVEGANGAKEIDLPVEIHPAHYRTGALTVAPRFVAPSPEEMKVIEAERTLKQEVFSHSAPEPLWHGDFYPPVRLLATDSFGTRRMFNGKLASIHTGTDFRARMGTPVRASNSGVVVLARKLYYEGNCVIIDHGLGLYTISMHFSRIDVHEGEHVRTGQILGLSGATGRVTGPHLHWAVRWEGANLDPVKLLKLNLDSLP